MKRVVAVALVTSAAGCGGGHAALLPPRCHVGVYFKPGATRAQIEAVSRKLASNKHVTRVVFVSKAQALRIMKRRFPGLVRRIPTGVNPLPDALYAHPKTRDDYAPIARSLQPRPPGIATVHYPRFGPCA